jgi:hypothetical protein
MGRPAACHPPLNRHARRPRPGAGPNRSFRFEDGRIVIEADVAAAIPEYEDIAAAEIDITTAPAPTGKVVDLQYGYGMFGGHWTFGCRFEADREVTCSLFSASGAPGDPTVFGNELGRVWQMLPFQHVGGQNYGGDATDAERAHTSAPAGPTRWTCSAATVSASS